MLGGEAGYALALNSLPFLLFLAAAVTVFFVAPIRARWLVVVVASYAFYASWEAVPAVGGLALMTVAAHLSVRGMQWWPSYRRLSCAVGLLISLGTLALLKYFNFFVAETFGLLEYVGIVGADASVPEVGWFLPVGFSFVTFSIASYVIDVYRREMEPARFTDFAAYVSYFPKILAGPIERAKHFLPQWLERRRFDPAKATEGFQLILWGLFKKVVIADRLGVFVDQAYGAPAFATPVELIVATYFYAFQIYCDFSGYTDIAIGAFKLFNFDLADNFKRPYLSRSIGEFWSKRWHITLATWFRDYLYIPLGGSRVARWRHLLNVMVVFMVSGIWHAGFVGTAVSWSFVLWGAINGLYQVVSTLLAPAFRALGRVMPALQKVPSIPGVAFLQAFGIFHLVTFTWIFFRAASISDAWTVVTRIADNVGNLPMLIEFYDYQNFDFLLSLLLIVSLLVIEVWHDRKPMTDRLRSWPTFLRWGYYYALILALVILGEWGTATFIYMQF